eukprot:6178743-Pleurochrysis_carterae.AAC.4
MAMAMAMAMATVTAAMATAMATATATATATLAAARLFFFSFAFALRAELVAVKRRREVLHHTQPGHLDHNRRVRRQVVEAHHRPVVADARPRAGDGGAVCGGEGGGGGVGGGVDSIALALLLLGCPERCRS